MSQPRKSSAPQPAPLLPSLGGGQEQGSPRHSSPRKRLNNHTPVPPLPAAAAPTSAVAATDGGNGATAQELMAAPATMDYADVYRHFCAEEGCKPNSAFVRYIQDRGGHFSLERLNLGNNYLGSRGLRPVMRMVDLCQTIVSINLEDNGITNEAIADVCDVLERHVSITSLNLSHNPISVVGGKRLLQLVENNPRITDVRLDGTDVFEGLQERIRMALQHNMAALEGSGPHLEANKLDGSRAGSPASSPRRGGGGGMGRRPGSPRTSAAAHHRHSPSPPPPKATLQPVSLNHSGSFMPGSPLKSTMTTDSSKPTNTAAAALLHELTLNNTNGSKRKGGPASAESPLDLGFGTPTMSTTSRVAWQEAAVGRVQLRTPSPAIASASATSNSFFQQSQQSQQQQGYSSSTMNSSKALPVNRVRDLKALFAERARLHTEINRGEASKRAYAAREELLALERHGHAPSSGSPEPHHVGSKGGTNQTYPGSQLTGAAAGGAAPSMSKTTAVPLRPIVTDRESTSGAGGALYRPHTAQQQRGDGDGAGYRPDNGSGEAPPQGGGGTNSPQSPSSPLDQQRRGDDLLSAAGGAAPLSMPSPTSPAPATAAAPSSPPPPPQAHTVEDILTPARMMLLTTEEQFTVLFDQGCREYLNRNMDAAYMSWNEAMRVAVGEGQREWMAVVASNLQRLSYELLVEEGAAHLERGELEKAGETFKLAYEVAAKAKNAVWERDMRAAKQNVLKALFHRCHEAALLLFSRAQEDARDGGGGGSGGIVVGDEDNAEVGEDDYFVLPGTEEMVRHTPAFVREWACLLLLKEAIGLWVEGTRVVAKLSEAAAAPLRENITEALNLVAGFMVQRHFNNTTLEGLLAFHTDAYLYHECVLLSDLWYDLVADSEQSLRHPLLSAICAAQLGELYVATFQLPQALVQLSKLERYGRLHKCAVLEATGLTLCGRVYLQRANYAQAEASLDAALELWAAVQSDPTLKKLMMTSSNGRYEVPVMDTAAVTAEMNGFTNTTAPTATTPGVADTNTSSNAVAVAGGNAKTGMSTLLADTRGGSAGGSNSGTAHFRIEGHLPIDATSVLASACRHYKVCLLLQTYRYRDALEALEYSLNVAYSDTLQDKLGRNYHLHPSLDEIAAIAGELQTSLVFYTLTSRYDWSVKGNAYVVEESLCTWVIAESREMRFVEVNLTKDFKCTMQSLIDPLRQRLCVEPGDVAVQSEIITELPSRTWQEPLRVLYQVCIHPIIGYLRASDAQLLFGDGVITVVPTGLLWLVPFHALLNVKAGDRYLVEEVAVQLAFSATQAAFAALSAERVQQHDLHREVVAVQPEVADRGVQESLFYTGFPFNADRSVREGEVVAAMLRAGQAQVAEWLTRRTTSVYAAGGGGAASTRGTGVFTHRVEVVEDVESLRAVLPRARTLHIATATTAAVPIASSTASSSAVVAASQYYADHHNGDGSARAEDEGGLLMCTASPMGDIGILRAAEIARMELFAEHVVLTSTNMSRQHVCGIRDDVLGLLRGFFGSGVPCVICGQWCTPDMEPMEVFQRFYTQWSRPPTASADASLQTMTRLSPAPLSDSRMLETVSEAGATIAAYQQHHNDGGAGKESDAAGQQQQQQQQQQAANGDNDASHPSNTTDREDEEVVRHRALLLARAIRRLLTEEPAMRYQPRVWAGYYCVGTGW